jgi:tetratricopeptide (TPR) repeat protein
VANGSTLEAEGDSRLLRPQRSMVLWNGRGEAFHDLEVGPLATPRVSRGLAVADYDGDGSPDVLIVHLDGGVQLLRNAMHRGSWLGLRLRHRLAGGGWGRGEGAAVVGWIGDVPLRRSVTGASYLSQSSAELSFGLGVAEGLDELEVRWPGGTVDRYGGLAGNAVWEIREGDSQPRRVEGGVPELATSGPPTDSRERVLAFWSRHRQAMDAMKRDEDPEKAIPLFREALALDPGHEDARYYLANCLWAVGDEEGALGELAELRRRAPGSLRAHLRWAAIQAAVDDSEEGLAGAVAAGKRALEINQEETGGLLLLGELELLRGRADAAERYLALAVRTNPRATGAFFLRGYLAWRQGRVTEARELLELARASMGPDWKPEGAVAEGDVKARLHQEGTPLAGYWTAWSGATEPDLAFATLERFLASR